MSVSRVPDPFEKYLLAEYNNIAQAHFSTIRLISSFFRYYLIVIALPISFIAAAIALGRTPQALFELISSFRGMVVIILIVISVTGLLILWYVISLRMDALLYARTVNTIRKYFYDRAPISLEQKLIMRVLPASRLYPPYFEIPYFLPVVLAFAILDGIYFGLALFIAQCDMLFVIVISLFFIFLHPTLYYIISRHWESSYLQSRVLGVDIDGVLADHRRHFCYLLHRNTGKKLRPGKITRIPVHEDPKSGVTQQDEHKVFNDPNYWTEMPVLDDGPKYLRKIRRSLGLSIYLFTHRPWPTEQQYVQNWRAAAQEILKKTTAGKLLKLYWSLKVKYGDFSRLIDIITTLWLKRSDIDYDKLVIEKDKVKRFNVVLRYFVEDETEHAVKLAYICEVVFLLDQPYNRRANLPSNVIPVDSWKEIYEWLRRFETCKKPPHQV